MEKPAIPDNEAARLQALRSLDILDTREEERFDRLTRLSRRLFRVPIALVSLVDENRQWFKSRDGLGVCETPRDQSFCAHAIHADDILLINDALCDPRFADNPLVTGPPHVRFYAGCPLRTACGHTIGTLCIIDNEPRMFEAEDRIALRDLAAVVEGELSAVQTATTDDLTKIANRRGFLQLAQYGLDFCARQQQPATLAFIDLDEFKPINDRFGHAEGDLALVAFSDTMRGSFRSTDLFARLGGDEFVVLLSGAARAEAQGVIGKLGAALALYNQEAGRGYELKFSAGLVEFEPRSHPCIDALLAAGDAQMYAIKAAKHGPGGRAQSRAGAPVQVSPEDCTAGRHDK